MFPTCFISSSKQKKWFMKEFYLLSEGVLKFWLLVAILVSERKFSIASLCNTRSVMVKPIVVS